MKTHGHDMPVDRSSAQRRVYARITAAVACRVVSLLIVLTAVAGCRDSQELEVSYGHRRGAAGKSVNGTSVLAGLFQEAGFRVSSSRQLSSTLSRCDVIVWVPDSFAPPSSDVREFFEKWLTSEEPKTLVYIGRDYDNYAYKRAYISIGYRLPDFWRF